MNSLTEPLLPWGWNPHFEINWHNLPSHQVPTGPLRPARITASFGRMVRAHDGAAEVNAQLRTSTVRAWGEAVVGDWVTLFTNQGVDYVDSILPRKTRFLRASAGPNTYDQVLAANFEQVWITTSLNQDFNPRRLERYAIAAWDSGATPYALLTKADICTDLAAYVAQAESVLPGIQVLAVSALTGFGMQALNALLSPGQTAVLLGMSGVGKSTLVNTLTQQEHMAVSHIREDDARGRHTTTHRELLPLPNGALLIDTPGMRTLGVFTGDTSEAFSDITRLAENCRFRDCKHQNEPGCAIQTAIQTGELDKARLASWQSLERELLFRQRKEQIRKNQENRQHSLTFKRTHLSDSRRGGGASLPLDEG